MRGTGLRDTAFLARATPTIVGTPPTITTTTLNALTQNSAFSQTLAATGDATITFAVTVGSLPAGLSLSSGGVLSGTPTASGAYSFTVTATNGAGSDTQAYSGNVAAAGSSPAISSLITTKGADVNGFYTYPAHATGDLIVVACSNRSGFSNYPVIPTSGPGGETVVLVEDGGSSNNAFVSLFYWVANATRASGNHSWVGGSGSANRISYCFKVVAGTFDTTTPVYSLLNTNTNAATTTSLTLADTVYPANDNCLLAYFAVSPTDFTGIPSGLTSVVSDVSAAQYAATFIATQDADALNVLDTLVGKTFASTVTSTKHIIPFVINAPNGTVPYYLYSFAFSMHSVEPTPNTAAGTGSLTVLGTTPLQEKVAGTTWEFSYRISTEPTTWTVAGTTTTLPYVISGLAPMATYYVRARKSNAAGYGGYYAGGTTYFTGSVPDAPSAPTVTPKSLFAKIEYSYPNNNGNSVQDFKIEYKQTASGTWLTWDENPLGVYQGTIAYVDGLLHNTSYDFRVSAINIIGSSLPSPVTSATPSTTYQHPNSVLATEKPLRVWQVTSQSYNTMTEAGNYAGNYVELTRKPNGISTPAYLGSSSNSNDYGTSNSIYVLLFEFDTSCTSVTSGNTQAPIIDFATAGANFTIEAWSNFAVGGSIDIGDFPTVSELVTKFNEAPSGAPASLDATGKLINSIHQMTKPGSNFKFGAVGGGSGRTFVFLTTNNHRLATAYNAYCEIDVYNCELKFTPG